MADAGYQAQLIELLSQSDPETLKELVALGVLSDEQGQMMDQLQRSEALRSTRLPRGEMRGRVYVPASGVENALAVYDRIRGEIGSAGAKGRLKGIRGEQTAGRSAYLDLLKGKQDNPYEEAIQSPFMF
jgi:hypothetical protein